MYIITGGAGYIGGHLVDRLVEVYKEEVLVIDNFSSGNYVNPKARLIKQDLRFLEINDNIFINYKNSIIYHLAANPSVKDSMLDVFTHFESDVKATLVVLELARRLDATKLIFTSSSTVYGEAKILPTPENAEKKPISNYGLFKLICENMIEYYSRVYGLRSIVIRLANVVGGRMNHGVIVDFIKKLRNDNKRLEILGNGKQKKSYIYISDVIDGFLLLESKVNESY
ncbi:MAG: NAD-dependent epimerase/dehydratase family protein, partial [Sulfolobaceae archaeon]